MKTKRHCVKMVFLRKKNYHIKNDDDNIFQFHFIFYTKKFHVRKFDC